MAHAPAAKAGKLGASEQELVGASNDLYNLINHFIMLYLIVLLTRSS